MEFETTLLGENYRFSLLDNSSVLVSCTNGEYILYKTKTWRCADDLPFKTVEKLGKAIEEHLQYAHS